MAAEPFGGVAMQTLGERRDLTCLALHKFDVAALCCEIAYRGYDVRAMQPDAGVLARRRARAAKQEEARRGR